MSLNFKSLIPRVEKPYLDNWAFKAFCLATFFILFFSVDAIHNWPTVIKRYSVLLACILPASIVVLCRIPTWLKAKQIPGEIIWVLTIFILGFISALSSEDKWTALKSIVLFMAAGPIIFVTTKYLFESTKNKDAFLWMNTLILVILCFWGIYEHNYNQSDYGTITLFSGNPLPAGTLLILLSASPMILLYRQGSPVLKFLLALGPALTVGLIILSAKRSHILGLIIVLLCLIIFMNRGYIKFLLGFVLLSGILLYFSEPTLSKYKSLINSNSSVLTRAENYFFALHVLKKAPVWGVGFKSDLTQHLDDYDLIFSNKISKSQYHAFIRDEKTFENIALAFMVEWGCLLSFVYFGGLAYILIACWIKIRAPSKNFTGILIVSVMVGFAIISLTFDTLRFPNLNWAFHSLLGLLVNISPRQS
jgi:hypothetical protein